MSGSADAHPRDDVAGAPLVEDGAKPHVGVDVKYTPNADNAIDLTVKPDFSQVESDTAQISANERFALFFPEKRPFFLEGVDLFQTPIQAVYTRTITAPVWGGRVTGKEAGIRYTALVADDAGGGSAIIPGPNGSSLASVDEGSTVFVARVEARHRPVVCRRARHRSRSEVRRQPQPCRRSRLSMAAVGHRRRHRAGAVQRDAHAESSGSGRRVDRAVVRRRTRPAPQWNHNTTHFDAYALYKDLGDGFRADTGFVPQVGYRETYGGGGWTFRPTGFVTRLRTFVNLDRQADRAGALISSDVEPGFGMDTRWNGFMQFRYIDEDIRAGDRSIGRKRFGYIAQFSPSRRVTLAVDRRHDRAGDRLRELASGHRHDDQPAGDARSDQSPEPAAGAEPAVGERRRRRLPASQRLFIARVSRRARHLHVHRAPVRARHRAVRLDRLATRACTSIRPTTPRDGTLTAQALLSYKLNWQSVMFVGYGDDRELTDHDQLVKSGRQVFVKLSYAFQR